MWWGYCGAGSRNRSAEQFFISSEVIVSQDEKNPWYLLGNHCIALQVPQVRLLANQLSLHVTGLGFRPVREELRVQVGCPQPASAGTLNWLSQRRVRDPCATTFSTVRAPSCSFVIQTPCCYTLAFVWGCGRENDLSYSHFFKQAHSGQATAGKQNTNPTLLPHASEQGSCGDNISTLSM